jgi:hypothetical protein
MGIIIKILGSTETNFIMHEIIQLQHVKIRKIKPGILYH